MSITCFLVALLQDMFRKILLNLFTFISLDNINELSSLWDRDNKEYVIVMACVAFIWSLWAMINELCFHGVVWKEI